jgi:hypothetical protein
MSEGRASERRSVEEPRARRVVSPELALVDEELGAWARLRLREDVAAATASQRTGRTAGEATPVAPPATLDAHEAPPYRRRRHRRRRLVYAAATVALLAGLSAYVRASRSSQPDATTVPNTPTVASAPTGRAFAWPAVKSARLYRFTLTRRGTLVYRADVRGHRLVLPHTWVYRGSPFTLAAGNYRWRVVALLGGRRTTGRVVVAAPLVVPTG